MKSALKIKFCVTALTLSLGLSTGCTEREVLDVETPAGDVEVTEDTETGEIDVDAEEN